MKKREREEWGEAGPGGERRVVIGPWASARVRVERQSAQPSSDGGAVRDTVQGYLWPGKL